MPACWAIRAGLCVAVAQLVLLSGVCPAEELSPQQVEFFEQKIRPVLVEHCYECHSSQSEKLQGKLLLDTREAARQGGESGAAVVPGDLGASLLLAALKYDGFEMPPKGKLSAEVIADFEQWIKDGAVDPREGGGAPAASSGIDFEKGRQFWSFQRPRLPELPLLPEARSRETRPQQVGRIDAFLLAKLDAAGLALGEPAERTVWLRRASFDFLGLPPTPNEVAAFEADTSPDAYERAVDRLLAAPQHGERVARLWLDLARYAEDQAHIVGKNDELFYPNAYLYRDWIIQSLNRDLPYDQFVKLQLAADLIEGEESPNLAALGLIGLGPKYYGRGSLAVRADEWEDRVDVVGRGLLGLTVACARCHDHKFDPIGADDYYALAGVFASTSMFNRPLRPNVELKEAREKDDDKKFENGNGSRGEAKKPQDALHIVRDGAPTDLNVFIRGSVENKGPLVPRRFIRVLAGDEPAIFTSGSGRRELGDAIGSADNPLTARVIVNRVWGLYVGRPLVATASNFGALGEQPTHPELLDDLSVRFVEHDWSLKWLAREIAGSRAYRQSSVASSAALTADPDNRLFSRMHHRRLTVEQWRDAVLTAAGRLESTVGGPSLDPADPAQHRRTIYSQASRLELNRMLAMFDYPDPNVHADRRAETTTPLQKLFVLNSAWMNEQSRSLAERLVAEVPAASEGDLKAVEQLRIERAYHLLYSRSPSEEEVQLGWGFLAAGGTMAESAELDRWQQYAQVLLAANELLYLE